MEQRSEFQSQLAIYQQEARQTVHQELAVRNSQSAAQQATLENHLETALENLRVHRAAITNSEHFGKEAIQGYRNLT